MRPAASHRNAAKAADLLLNDMWETLRAEGLSPRRKSVEIAGQSADASADLSSGLGGCEQPCPNRAMSLSCRMSLFLLVSSALCPRKDPRLAD